MPDPTADLHPCPGCGIPRLLQVIGRSPCPLCADTAPLHSVGSPPIPSPPQPQSNSPNTPALPSVDPSARSTRATPTLALFSAFALGTLTGGLAASAGFVAWSHLQSLPPAESAPEFRSPIADQLKQDSSPPPSLPTPSEPISQAVPPTWENAATSGPKPDQLPPDRPVLPADHPPPPAAPNPLEAIVLHLDQPDATFTLPEEWLRPGQKVVLHGRVRELRLSGLPPRFQLDAARLAARSVSITGPPLEKVRLHLYAPEGAVACRTAVGSGTHLRIEAPGGTVRFGSANPWRSQSGDIGPEADVTILARQVQADVAVRGARTTVRIDCTPPARLHFQAIRQGAVVEYRHAPGTSRAPIQAQAETVEPSAVFRLATD